MIDDARTVTTLFRLIRDEGLFIGACRAGGCGGVTGHEPAHRLPMSLLAGASSALNVVAAGDIARRLGPGHTV